MASPARVRANQVNAQQSTGPRTLAGRAASAQNARRHGLAARLARGAQRLGVASGADPAAARLRRAAVNFWLAQADIEAVDAARAALWARAAALGVAVWLRELRLLERYATRALANRRRALAQLRAAQAAPNEAKGVADGCAGARKGRGRCAPGRRPQRRRASTAPLCNGRRNRKICTESLGQAGKRAGAGSAMGFRTIGRRQLLVAGLAIGSALGANAAAAFPELIENGGFEAADPRFKWTGDNAYFGDGAPYGAPGSLNVVAGFIAGSGAISQPVRVVPERIYAFSFNYGVYANSSAPTGDGDNTLKITWGNGTIATLTFTQVGGGPGQVGSAFNVTKPYDPRVLFTAPLEALPASGTATAAAGWSRAAIIGFGSRGFRTGDLKFSYSYGDLAFFIDNVSLLVTWAGGPDAAATEAALRQNAAVLRGVMDRRLSTLAQAANHDCATFGQNNACLSFQARYSAFESTHEGAGVFTAAYRVTDTLRLGGFIDQRVSETEPTGVRGSSDTPTFGVFAGYSQKSEGAGLQAKVLAAYSRGDLTISRDVAQADAEPGSGKARVRSWLASGEVGWGFALSSSMVVTPYVGLRQAAATRGAYTEQTSDAVLFPISYAAFADRRTTIATGVRLNGMMTEKVGYQVAAGVEGDLNRKARAYSGASDIVGLDYFALAPDGARNRTRGTGSIGLFYQSSKTMRLTGQFSIRSQASGHEPQVSAMAGWQVAF